MWDKNVDDIQAIVKEKLNTNNKNQSDREIEAIDVPDRPKPPLKTYQGIIPEKITEFHKKDYALDQALCYSSETEVSEESQKIIDDAKTIGNIAAIVGYCNNGDLNGNSEDRSALSKSNRTPLKNNLMQSPIDTIESSDDVSVCPSRFSEVRSIGIHEDAKNYMDIEEPLINFDQHRHDSDLKNFLNSTADLFTEKYIASWNMKF